MKIRTSLGAGIAAAAVAATVLGVATPALAAPGDETWHTPLVGLEAANDMAVSGDGATAYVLGRSADGPAVLPVDLTSGVAGAPVGLSASYTTGSPAAHGDAVAVTGVDADYNGAAWTVTDGTASPVTLPGNTGGSFYVQAVTSTPDGFLAVGAVDGCLATWTWAADATTATESEPTCSDSDTYLPNVVATAADGGTTYAAVADTKAADGSITQQLWNLSDPDAAPIDLPDDLGAPSGMTVGPDGTVYVAGSGADSDELRVATVHPGAPGSDTIISAGTPDVDSGQLALVDGHLWVGTWYGVVDLDLAGTATYTPDSPAPLLTTTNGTPQSFLATTDADYLLLPWDSSFADADGNAAPGILKVVSPDAPAPTATLDGTTATVAWDASANGGSEITSATVTATDTTTGTTLAPVRSDFSGFDDNAYLDTDSETATVDVTGLTTGHTYTFSVTQGNGFKSSQEGTSAPVTVALAATAKPSRITVVGTPRVGTRLTTRATGSWASGATLTYAWYAGTTKVGTASSYTPTTATAGKRIKVAVTGTAAGHAPSTVTSAATAPVSLPVYKVSHKPTITGKAKVGRILTAHITGLPRHAVVKYQWGYSGGQYGGGIGHRTTKRTLKVPASVRHTRIEVIVYVTVPGYSTGSAMSRLTAVVK